MLASAARARIMVADDESSIRIGCQKILSEDGHEVVAVADGLAAVETFRSHPFDLVLLDLSMPGLDGLQVIPRLREIDPGAVVVMITGYASFETAVQAIQAGAYDYVPKPFTPSELRIVVKRALEKRALIVERLELQRERERSLKDLAYEQSRTRTIINAMAEPLLVVNAARELVFVNPAARRFLAEGATGLGQPLREALGVPELIEAIETALPRLAGAPQAVSTEVTDPREGKTWLLNVAELETGSHDETAAGAVLVLSDITPMKDLEKAKTRFVSIVAHELKAPVAAIEGYLDLILGDLEPAIEKYRPKIERCRERADLLQKLIRELLDLSRIEQGRIERTLEPLDPLPVVRDTCEFLAGEAAKKNVSVTVEAGSAAVRLLADRGELTQIFTNLISNAIKYNRDGGSVTVTSEVSGSHWKVAVRDTGIGISESHLAHIGEEFFRVKNSTTVKISGTGLGMAIVKRLLDLNHARLEIASKEGEGSTFTLFWPLAS